MSGECRAALARGEWTWYGASTRGHIPNINNIFARPSLEERDKLERESKHKVVDWKKEGF